jgi:hypothetical protein
LLFATAFCRRAWSEWYQDYDEAFAIAERCADGKFKKTDVRKVQLAYALPWHFLEWEFESVHKREAYHSPQAAADQRQRYRGYCTLFCDVFRDVFGNPFRPVCVDPSWLTSTVAGLARAIYADGALARLPALASALEEAGCTEADLLVHCRGPGPHVRGCWVVDLLLNKR